jgi:hypothetical protein
VSFDEDIKEGLVIEEREVRCASFPLFIPFQTNSNPIRYVQLQANPISIFPPHHLYLTRLPNLFLPVFMTIMLPLLYPSILFPEISLNSL